jgi:hypothetical protein
MGDEYVTSESEGEDDSDEEDSDYSESDAFSDQDVESFNNSEYDKPDSPKKKKRNDTIETEMDIMD